MISEDSCQQHRYTFTFTWFRYSYWRKNFRIAPIQNKKKVRRRLSQSKRRDFQSIINVLLQCFILHTLFFYLGHYLDVIVPKNQYANNNYVHNFVFVFVSNVCFRGAFLGVYKISLCSLFVNYQWHHRKLPMRLETLPRILQLKWE